MSRKLYEIPGIRKTMSKDSFIDDLYHKCEYSTHNPYYSIYEIYEIPGTMNGRKLQINRRKWPLSSGISFKASQTPTNNAKRLVKPITWV